MSQPFKLYRLQQIDSQLDKIISRLAEIEAILQDDEALRRALQREEQASSRLAEERKLLKRAEQDVQSQRIKIEQTEATLYGGKVRNPKELQDLQNESAALKRYLNVLEDRQLEAMIEVETAEAESEDAKQQVQTVRERSAEQHKDLVAEQEELIKDKTRLESERAAACSSIRSDEIQLYESLRTRRRGIAVAMVRDKACSACGSTLSAALLGAARSPSQIARCDACGRILYAG